jgi:hypothetical protein
LAGLDGEWRVSETSFGDEVLTLVRDKALRSLSAGFSEGRNRWHTRDRVTRLTATLDHAALGPPRRLPKRPPPRR